MVIATSSLQQIKFWIPGRVVPKARPRITKNCAYLPINYRQWRRMAEVEIERQVISKSKLPIKQALIEVKLTGKHRGDLDNLSGSCLDALVSAGVLADDNVNCVSSLLVTYTPIGTLGVLILIQPQAAPKENVKAVKRK